MFLERRLCITFACCLFQSPLKVIMVAAAVWCLLRASIFLEATALSNHPPSPLRIFAANLINIFVVKQSLATLINGSQAAMPETLENFSLSRLV